MNPIRDPGLLRRSESNTTIWKSDRFKFDSSSFRRSRTCDSFHPDQLRRVDSPLYPLHPEIPDQLFTSDINHIMFEHPTLAIPRNELYQDYLELDKFQYCEMNTLVNHYSSRNNLPTSSVYSLVANDLLANPIHESVRKCDPDTLQKQLRSDATQINATDSFGNTALHYAAVSKDQRCLKILLNHPMIDVNMRNLANRTPLHWALDKSNQHVIASLVRRKDTRLDEEPDSDGYTCLRILIEKHPKLATKLLKLKPKRLLKALLDKELYQFAKILEQEDHVHYFYSDDVGTLLDIACRSPGRGMFVKILLEKGARINAINPDTGRAAIHEAVLNSDVETVRILRQEDQCDVNVMDKQGNSALHHAVVRNDVEIIGILLQREGCGNQTKPDHFAMDISGRATRIVDHSIHINAINQKNQTPLHLALLKNKRRSIDILLEHPDIDLDVQKDLEDRTCRQIIARNFPDIERTLQQADSNSNSTENLFSLLHRRDTNAFVERIQLGRLPSTISNGRYTYLQYACKYGMVDVVRALFNSGIDPNDFSSFRKLTPIMIAGHEGYYEILSMLLDHPQISFEPIESMTLLHSIMEGMLKTRDSTNIVPNKHRDHFRCLQMLNRVIQEGILDINFGDKNGNTVLHMAASLDNYEVLKYLLDNGAYLGEKNNSGVEPVKVMNPATLRQYLDSCVTSKGRLIRDNYKIIFTYQSLIPPTTASVSEIETLNAMIDDNDLKPILQHPVLRSYLDLKWQSLKIYSYANLAFYVFFWVSLNFYFYDYFSNYRISNNISSSGSRFHNPLNIAVCILCSILALRETYQYVLSPRLYLSSTMNFFEWLLIVLVFAFVSFNSKISHDHRKILAGLAIILSSIELITLIGRLPTFANCIPMVQAVLKNCLKFVFWYWILLLGVTFGFHIIESVDKQQPFNSQIATFFYNVTLMSLGRGIIPSVKNDQSLKLSDVLLIPVILLTAITIGLAYSTVSVVNANRKIFSIVSRIRSIHRAESIANEDTYGIFRATRKLAEFLFRCGTSPTNDITGQTERRRFFYKSLRLTDYIVSNYQIAVEPNRDNVVLIPMTGSSSSQLRKSDSYFKKSSWVVDPSVVACAANVLENRNARNEVVSRSEFQRMEKTIANLMNILESKSK